VASFLICDLTKTLLLHEKSGVPIARRPEGGSDVCFRGAANFPQTTKADPLSDAANQMWVIVDLPVLAFFHRKAGAFHLNQQGEKTNIKTPFIIRRAGLAS
jgi:hypothetical protein